MIKLVLLQILILDLNNLKNKSQDWQWLENKVYLNIMKLFKIRFQLQLLVN